MPSRILDYMKLAQEELHYTDNFEKSYSDAKMLIGTGCVDFIEIDNTGIFAYLIGPDMIGGTSLSEAFFYIYPNYRGSIKLVKKYINSVEAIAKERGCNSIKIGANIGYKDSLLIKLLRRWGYTDESVRKDLDVSI